MQSLQSNIPSLHNDETTNYIHNTTVDGKTGDTENQIIYNELLWEKRNYQTTQIIV
jgi:hypothetical protein